jgi:hypothetical protein
MEIGQQFILGFNIHVLFFYVMLQCASNKMSKSIRSIIYMGKDPLHFPKQMEMLYSFGYISTLCDIDTFLKLVTLITKWLMSFL